MTVWKERLKPILTQLDDLRDELACFDYLIGCAGEPGWEFDETLRRNENLLKGCDSRMWLDISVSDEGCLRIRADSDSMLLRGMLVLLRKLYENLPVPVSAAAGLQLLRHPIWKDCFSAKQLKNLHVVCKHFERIGRKDVHHEKSH